jgi:thiol-disulfide isomerase/thioredoxin
MILAAALSVLLAATDWLNGMPTAQTFRGKVVLVDVFTFNCINCKNVTPNLRKLNAAHRSDLAIVGVHAPETPFERDRTNVIVNLKRQGIVWPVAIDNDFRLLNALRAPAWPTQFIYDRHGVLRKTIVGDSQDELVDATIKKLLAER